MKILFLRHKYVTLLAGAALSVAVFAAAAMPAAVSASTTERQLPIYCVNRDQKVCAISFDAAWGDASTQSLVDILNQYNVKATFFVIGNWAEQYPEDVKMLKENGMEVMNHSSAHGHMNQMSSEEIIADIKKCNDQIEALTGECPTLFRAPYGEYDDHVIAAVRSIGMEPVSYTHLAGRRKRPWPHRTLKKLRRSVTSSRIMKSRWRLSGTTGTRRWPRSTAR